MASTVDVSVTSADGVGVHRALHTGFEPLRVGAVVLFVGLLIARMTVAVRTARGVGRGDLLIKTPGGLVTGVKQGVST